MTREDLALAVATAGLAINIANFLRAKRPDGKHRKRKRHRRNRRK